MSFIDWDGDGDIDAFDEAVTMSIFEDEEENQAAQPVSAGRKREVALQAQSCRLRYQLALLR